MRAKGIFFSVQKNIVLDRNFGFNGKQFVFVFFFVKNSFWLLIADHAGKFLRQQMSIVGCCDGSGIDGGEEGVNIDHVIFGQNGNPVIGKYFQFLF